MRDTIAVGRAHRKIWELNKHLFDGKFVFLGPHPFPKFIARKAHP
jgi:hypothetical protein